MITTLLAAGADIEAWDVDRMGRTPLYIAAGDESAAVAHGTGSEEVGLRLWLIRPTGSGALPAYRGAAVILSLITAKVALGTTCLETNSPRSR